MDQFYAALWTYFAPPLTTGRASIRSAGKPADLRLVAVRFSDDKIYRLMMVTPLQVEPRVRQELQRTTYSFRRLAQREAAGYRVAVQSGDTVESLAQRMPFEDYQVARFQTLNGLSGTARLSPGHRVKIVTD